MADENLRLQAEVVDKFTGPLRKLRDGLRNIKQPADMDRLKGGFEGVNKAARSAGDGIKSGFNAAVAAAGIGSISAAGAVSLLVASLKGFAFGTSELRAFSKETGISVGRLRELQALGDSFHIDPSTTTAGLQKFSQKLFNIKRRVGETYGQLHALAPDFAEQLVGSKNIEEAVGRALTFLARIPDAVKRQRYAEMIFGSGAFGRFGSEGMEGLRGHLKDVQDALGKLPAGAAESAEKFYQAFKGFQDTLTGIRDEVGTATLPRLTEQLGELQKALKNFDWKTFGENLNWFLKDTVKSADDLIQMFRDIRKMLHGDFSPLKDAFSFKNPGSPSGAQPDTKPRLLVSPSIGSRERDNVVADLVRREAQIRSRLEEARRNDDQKAIERLTRKLEENTEELKRNREATVEKQSFDGGDGSLGGLIHKAVYGGAATSVPSVPSFRKGANGFGRPRGKDELPALSDDPFLNLIGRAEGTDKGRGYNETLGYGAFTGGPQNLTGMTLDQIDKLQTQMLRNPRNRFNSSAVGRYQIVRTTLRRLRQQLGLKGDELYDEGLQDRLARRLYQQRGNNPSGLRNEWEGLRRVPESVISRSYADSIRRSSDAMARRNRERQTVEGNAKLRIDLNGFPRGTRMTPQADGMFKEIELNRGRAMADGTDI